MALSLVRPYDPALALCTSLDGTYFIPVDRSDLPTAQRLSTAALLFSAGGNPGATEEAQQFDEGITFGTGQVGTADALGVSLDTTQAFRLASDLAYLILERPEGGLNDHGVIVFDASRYFYVADATLSPYMRWGNNSIAAYVPLDMGGFVITNLPEPSDDTDAATKGWTTSSFSASGHSHSYEPANANIQSHIAGTNNPHNTTYAQVGAAASGHNHDVAYSLVDHHHNAAYSAIGHAHNSAYAQIDHVHADYAATDHDHAGYSATDHTHGGVYSVVGHDHTGVYSTSDHVHSGVYSVVGHDHTGVYSDIGHAHASLYSALGHTHAAGDIASGTVAVARLPGMVGATVSVGGIAGLVPAPVAGDHLKALFGDGTYRAINTGGDMYKATYDADDNGFVDFATGLRTSASVSLSVGAVADTELLVRSGTNIVGLAQSTFATAGHDHAATYQPLDAGLTALAAFGSNGFVVRTATDTYTARSFAAGEAIAVSNADGVAGNVSYALSISGLTAETNLDTATDYVVVWDASATAHRKVLLSYLPSSGEANTASNYGVGGVGLYDSKNGVDLRFRNLNASSSKITVTLDDPNHEVDIDVAEANLTLGNMGGSIDLSGSKASGILAAARFPALTGDVTTTSGAVATTIAANAVTNAKMATMAANTIKANATGSAAVPGDVALAASQFLGRKAAGNITAYSITDAAYDLLDDTDAATMRATLGANSASNLTTGTLDAARLPTATRTRNLFITIDNGGTAITTGQKGHITSDVTGTIQQVSLFADQSGSIVIDIWKDTYANFPPTVADTITASAKPTLASAQKSQDSTLTGWTTAITAGDVLAFNVDSASTVTRVLLALKVLV